MDPIVKLLEEDEDESMHSGADVDAFQAALNRDIGGTASTSQTSVANSGNIHSPSQSFASWQNTMGSEISNLHRQHSLESTKLKEQRLSEHPLQHQQHNDAPRANEPSLQHNHPQDNRQQGHTWQNASQNTQTSGLQISEKKPLSNEPEQVHNQDSESQYAKLQKMSSQQASSMEQSGNPINRNPKSVPFAALLPTIITQLDKDRAMQLHTLYAKLKKNEISKDGFMRHMKDIVGDQMLRMAVSKLQQGKMGTQAATRQNQPRMAAMSSANVQKPEPDSRGISVSQMSSSSSSMSASVQGLNKHPQQHMQFQPSTYPMYANNPGSYHPYPGPSMNSSVSSIKTQPLDSHMRLITNNQSLGSTSFGGSTQSANTTVVPKIERTMSTSEPSRLQGGSHFSNNSPLQISSAPRQGTVTKEQISGPLSSMTYVKHESVGQGFEKQQRSHLPTQHGSTSAQIEQGNATPGSLKDELDKQSARIGVSTPNSVIQACSDSPSRTTALDSSSVPSSRAPLVSTQAAVNARIPPKKPSIGQKKPLDSLGSSSPPASKKQKVSGTSMDQSIEQLNDVTAVSGVNLREEEEQLFSGPKEDSRVSEASRRVVQEEEERLILHKTPLQKKLAEIMVKYGLKHISNDVERCLSLCVEERMRGLLSNMIRVSKQRVDFEKPRHQHFITLDIRQQITEMNQKVKDEWEKKQTDAEKLKKLNDPEGDVNVDGEEKDDGSSKSMKINKEEDDKMRTTAANVAARAAVGGDDMLSKWQLMAEQARQKREGGSDISSGSHTGKDVGKKNSSAQGRNAKASGEAGRRGSATAASRKSGRNQMLMSQPMEVQTISIKDVIATLEREPKMSKSSLIYRLYNKVSSEPSKEQS